MDIDISCSFCQVLYHISIYFWYSDLLCASQELEVVKNAENDAFSVTFSRLVSILAQI